MHCHEDLHILSRIARSEDTYWENHAHAKKKKKKKKKQKKEMHIAKTFLTSMFWLNGIERNLL